MSSPHSVFRSFDHMVLQYRNMPDLHASILNSSVHSEQLSDLRFFFKEWTFWLASHGLVFLDFSSSFPHLPFGWWGEKQQQWAVWEVDTRDYSSAQLVSIMEWCARAPSAPGSRLLLNCLRADLKTSARVLTERRAAGRVSLMETYTRSQAYLLSSLPGFPSL